MLKPTGAIYVFADVKSGLRLFANWARNVIVWDKCKIGMGYAWRRQHEWIGYRPMPKHKLRDQSMSDVIRVDGVQDKEHPTQKPQGIVRPLVKNSTDHGASSWPLLRSWQSARRHCPGVPSEKYFPRFRK